MLVGDTVAQPLERSSTGAFQALLPPGAGRATLTVSVPEHWVTDIPVVLPPERPARFTIRPRALVPRDTITRARLIGDFNAFDAKRAVPLQRGADGRLRADIPYAGGTARFQVSGIGGPDDGAWMPVNQYAVAKDSSTRGPFAGVLAPVRDTLRFVIDPAAFGTAYQRPPSITTHTSDSALALVNALTMERHDAQRYRGILRQLRPRETDSTWYRARAHARARTNSAQDPRVRAVALVSLLAMSNPMVELPVDDARVFLGAIPPGSPILRDADAIEALSVAMYSRDTAAFQSAADSARRVVETLALERAYYEPLARDRTLPPTVRAAAYTHWIFGSRGVVPQATLDDLIDEAVAAMPDDPNLKTMPTSFGRQRVLREGAPFPSFSMRQLADTLAAPIRNESFRGKVTLIDFWGMWCAPCVEEMPVLHAAYEKFASRGFTIVSIDTDFDLDRVAAFRKTKWPMPWLHGWTGDGPMSPALQALGVTGFPTAVLVDREGKIISVNVGLRGKALDQTLERVLR